MANLEKIRNISVIAHIDHGKSTLTDSFVARAGLMSEQDAGDKRWTDGRADEKERGITIKSTGVSMNFDFEDKQYLVNLIDSPGHVDFSSEVTSALRITDGAIVVVDAVEGVAVQTETVLRQALAEQVKPILFINKMDRYMFELHLKPEEAYEKIVNILNIVNNIISTYSDNDLLVLSPELGNVYFGSGLHNWGFGLYNFARLFAKKLNVDEKDFMKKLWGEHYFNNHKIVTHSMEDGKPLERTFCKFVLGPIFKLVEAIMTKDSVTYNRILNTFNVKLSERDVQKPEKELYKHALKKALPVVEALLHGIAYHLPSPRQAQQYRVTTLYDGPLDDEYASAIKNCDPSGPLMIYVSKMIPMDDGGRFYAFGRVFSGTVSTGQKVCILGSNYKYGEKMDFFENKSIQGVAKMIGGKADKQDCVACGNTVALIGIDKYVLKSCTVTTNAKAYPIKTMKFTVSPVVRVSVSVKNPADLPKLVDGLKKLSKSDPCVYVSITDEEMIVCGVGELHVEICLNDLRNYVKSEIKVSEPTVPLRETVLSTSHQVCLSKSPNKHNRLYVTAEPANSDAIKDKIWFYGPEGEDETNVFVDTTKGIQYLNEIKDHVKGGFEWSVRKGILCDEPVRGVKFNLMDVVLHADAIHRGAGQITPATRRVIYAAMLTAKPAIMEPIFIVEIQVPDSYIGVIYSCLSQKRGRVISEEKFMGNLSMIKGHLPVLESFGFNGFIREATSGQAFPQMMFSHWEIIPGDPLDQGTKVGQIVRSTRKRKGLKEDVPSLNEFLDKL